MRETMKIELRKIDETQNHFLPDEPTYKPAWGKRMLSILALDRTTSIFLVNMNFLLEKSTNMDSWYTNNKKHR